MENRLRGRGLPEADRSREASAARPGPTGPMPQSSSASVLLLLLPQGVLSVLATAWTVVGGGDLQLQTELAESAPELIGCSPGSTRLGTVVVTARTVTEAAESHLAAKRWETRPSSAGVRTVVARQGIGGVLCEC